MYCTYICMLDLARATCILTTSSTYMSADRYRSSGTCAARLIDPSDDQASLSVKLLNNYRDLVRKFQIAPPTAVVRSPMDSPLTIRPRTSHADPSVRGSSFPQT